MVYTVFYKTSSFASYCFLADTVYTYRGVMSLVMCNSCKLGRQHKFVCENLFFHSILLHPNDMNPWLLSSGHRGLGYSDKNRAKDPCGNQAYILPLSGLSFVSIIATGRRKSMYMPHFGYFWVFNGCGKHRGKGKWDPRHPVVSIRKARYGHQTSV